MTDAAVDDPDEAGMIAHNVIYWPDSLGKTDEEKVGTLAGIVRSYGEEKAKEMRAHAAWFLRECAMAWSTAQLADEVLTLPLAPPPSC